MFIESGTWFILAQQVVESMHVTVFKSSSYLEYKENKHYAWTSTLFGSGTNFSPNYIFQKHLEAFPRKIHKPQISTL